MSMSTLSKGLESAVFYDRFVDGFINMYLPFLNNMRI
jgi:hypothetical protein